MSEQEKQESQKTIIAFVAGLLIGGLLVWVFTDSPSDSSPTDNAMMNTEQTDRMSGDDETMEDSSDATADTSTDSEMNENDNGVNDTEPVNELPTGDGEVSVSEQPAGARVMLDGASFPTDEGWIGVRDYVGGQLAGILGVARYSKEQGLVPDSIPLQRATEAGNTYAIVFFNDNGDREFRVADDSQIEGIFGTFTAQ